ncbi:FUSC family protein [Bradyrhizobium sp. 6(2017)]|uniref:FUSC family protein n=1 Tax=Bradyrhizobium sp. 6(2017) TaxID=1197460 RepID=UPI001FF04E3A|nr:FUSC family protein [Bradyrhizobium sp. 6(2017)]
MSTTVDSRPMTFAGFPASSWTFAIRIWLAIVVALYAAFWLELEAPSSAAVTVAVLALPTRGQALEKAAFRLIATVIGVAASVAIVGMFVQTGALLLSAFAAWLGICVYAVGLLDGNRAYAAALSGYTVAIIAVQQIDNPQHVFESGVARGAAIAVGILVVTVVNDLLVAPDQHPRLAAQLEALRRRLAGYAERVLRGEPVPAMTTAGLLREIAAQRPEINSLGAESSNGPARSAAARDAMVGMVAELFAIRALELLPRSAPPGEREQVVAQLEANSNGIVASPHGALSIERDMDSRDLLASGSLWFTERMLRMDGEVRGSLTALVAGTRPSRAWRAPLYRSRRIAAESGVRAAACFLLVASFFALSGWSTTEVSLSFVAIIIGLRATTPDPRAFTTIAVVVAPLASLMAGILEFVVLDGATAFPLLAIALAPFMIGAALLMTVPNRIVSALGRLNLVFILVLFAPSNPETYNPQTFLFSVLFLVLATSLLFAADILIPPVSPDRHRQWLLASARRDLRLLPSWQNQELAPEEALFRDAGRIAEILAVGGSTPEHQAAVEEAMAAFDQAAALRLGQLELDRLMRGPLRAEARAAHAALGRRDPASMIAAAEALRQGASLGDVTVAGASAALVLASVVFTPPRSGAESLAETSS